MSGAERRTPTDAQALLEVTDDIQALVSDYETATIAVLNIEDHDPRTVASTLGRLNDRLEAAAAKLNAARGGHIIRDGRAQVRPARAAGVVAKGEA